MEMTAPRSGAHALHLAGHVAAVLLLTLLTQVGGIVWLAALTVSRRLAPRRMREALSWLSTQGRAHGVEKVFVEPHLAARFNASGPASAFRGAGPPCMTIIFTFRSDR